MIRSTMMALAAATLLAAPAIAADWPTKPITMVIGYKAGGGTDTVGRVVAKVLSRELGQQINVVNKPGAGGGVAAMQVARARNDGYTIMMLPSSSVTSGPHLSKKVRVKVDDFEYAGMITAFQPALVAPMNAPFNNWEEMIAHGKKVGSFKYSAFNPMSRMLGQYIEREYGIKFNIVPTKGGAGMLNVVLGGEVDLAYSGGIHSRHPDKIKAIVPVTSERQPATPDMKTLSEMGIPFAADAMATIFAPKGTSSAIMDKIAAAIKVASTDADVMDISKKTRFPIYYRDRKATLAEMKKQWDNYAGIVKAAGYVAK